ncbi:hypothetical protein pEaSNUABM21_00024 [Erwinia phage pEa_SNUABM_21]|nr:hypothetical protein pEaSNUABM21_00024 [Erwinia phage pEa_SNUABM_21]
MISDIDIGHYYCSASGIPFRVKERAAHGQDCSLSMIVFENVEATKDYPVGQTWVLPESLFVKQYSEFTEGKYHERNNALRASEIKTLATREAFRVAFAEDPDSATV